MLADGFNIYNASAGSGKTYQITKSYLKLVLAAPSLQTIRQILAITFTNKAVAEMKNRILETLHAFTQPEIPIGSRTMFNEISEELKLGPAALASQAKYALKGILHNYTYFDILTIDKFTYRIIRTFAKDLKLSQQFEVELDSDVLLDKAISKVLYQIGKDPQLTKVLVEFSLEKIDSEKSWDIVPDLKKIGKLLFEENHIIPLQELKEKDIPEFEALKSLLKTKINSLKSDAAEKASIALQIIREQGFDFEDFPRQTLPNHFIRIQEGETDVRKLYEGKRLEEHLSNGTILKKSVEETSTGLSSALLPLFLEIKNALNRHKFYLNIYGHILPLTLLNEIGKAVKEIQEETDTLHISEFNTMISSEIQSQPAPYIYERLGERYRHYFIDEFQDTSQLQWNNLVPLIENALESENLKGQRGSLLLVGDGKQSIYRWRGGKPEQFLDLCNGNVNPFSVAPQLHQLNTNWRSSENIVDFNNNFFTYISSVLSRPAHNALYQTTSTQTPNNTNGGYVEISFLPGKEATQKELYLNHILQSIEKLLLKGHTYGDICILVRKNEQGELLANYLTSEKIPIISSEGLLLKNNPEVLFLVDFLRFVNSPEERALQYEVLQHLIPDGQEQHDLIQYHLDEMPAFLDSVYGCDIQLMSSMNLLDIVEMLIAIFKLSPDSNAFLNQFVDIIIEHTVRESMSIHDFLNYWDLKKDKLSITMPENLNAVTIMTVHKSKGLEFKFVIFPFADTKINSTLQTKKLWIPKGENDFLGFEHVLVGATKEVPLFSHEAAHVYDKEAQESELDDINVLYVALTRAVLGLFIKTSPQVGLSYGNLFEEFLKQRGEWDEAQPIFSFGTIPENKNQEPPKLEHQALTYSYSSKDVLIQKLIVAPTLLWNPEAKEALERGNILHSIMAQVHSEDDLDLAMQHLTALPVPLNEQVYYDNITKAIVRHDKLRSFYGADLLAKNEVEIMDADGTLLRPDRLVFGDQGVAILDYKTGGPNLSHEMQLNRYSKVLEKMGYVVWKKILVYIGETVEPIFI